MRPVVGPDHEDVPVLDGEPEEEHGGQDGHDDQDDHAVLHHQHPAEGNGARSVQNLENIRIFLILVFSRKVALELALSIT